MESSNSPLGGWGAAFFVCAVHFILDKNNLLSDEPIRQMLSALGHRGPDANGFLKIPLGKSMVFIGNNRLKINDLRNEANQPFVSSDQNNILTFNGEIYNHILLKQTLHRKYQFQTSSDTETLLYQLIEKGESGVSELNGMFAFAFLDKYNQKILVARDRFGMKPLYQFETQDFLIISSEIKGILASGLVTKKLNFSQIPHYLRFRYACPPETFFEGISEVKTGEVLTFSVEDFSWKSSNFGNEKPAKNSEISESFDEKTTISELETLLLQSVENHLKADVSVGLFLSGGVDSTLILALANELGYKNLPTFSICNQKLTQDENFARKASKQFHSEHFEIQTDSRLLLDFDTFIRKIDQPVADSAAWLTYLLAEKARQQGIKAVLSGAGADEFFGGYNRHQAFQWYLKNYKFLTQNIRFLQNTARFLPKQLRLVQKFLSQIDVSSEQTFLNFTALTAPQPPKGKLIDSDWKYVLELQSFKARFGSLGAALRFDQENFLKNDVLKMTDQMSMQASTEVRLPYLDLKIAELSHSLSEDYLLKNGKKWLLKKILTHRSGKIYTQRRKEGLGFPFADWLFMQHGKEILEILENKSSIIYEYVDFQSVKEILQLHKYRKADYSSEIWATALLAGWLKENFS